MPKYKLLRIQRGETIFDVEDQLSEISSEVESFHPSERNVLLKNSAVDNTEDNNALTSDASDNVYFCDKNSSRHLGRVYTQFSTDGSVSTRVYARTQKPRESEEESPQYTQNVFIVGAKKDGSVYYNCTNKSKFREDLGITSAINTEITDAMQTSVPLRAPEAVLPYVNAKFFNGIKFGKRAFSLDGTKMRYDATISFGTTFEFEPNVVISMERDRTPIEDITENGVKALAYITPTVTSISRSSFQVSVYAPNSTITSFNLSWIAIDMNTILKDNQIVDPFV